jgi:hypothetical protein
VPDVGWHLAGGRAAAYPISPAHRLAVSDRSVALPPATHRATHASHEGQDHADDGEDDPNRPEDGDARDEGNDRQDDAKRGQISPLYIGKLPRDGLYWTLWRTLRIGGQTFFGLLAQLSQGAVPVGLVLVVRQATGSLATAGALSAALWIVAAIARPLRGRLIDQRGSRTVILMALAVMVAAAPQAVPALSCPEAQAQVRAA